MYIIYVYKVLEVVLRIDKYLVVYGFLCKMCYICFLKVFYL